MLRASIRTICCRRCRHATCADARKESAYVPRVGEKSMLEYVYFTVFYYAMIARCRTRATRFTHAAARRIPLFCHATDLSARYYEVPCLRPVTPPIREKDDAAIYARHAICHFL